MAAELSKSVHWDRAVEMALSFSQASGICCRVLSEKGELLHRYGAQEDECSFLRGLPGQPPACEHLHLRGLLQAERFGGRYIYSCPSGLTYFSSPIVIGGIIAGALLAGPVLIMDVEDCLEDIAEKRCIPAAEADPLRQFLSSLPQVEPSRLKHLSTQLFAGALCVSDSSRELLRMEEQGQQQRSIGETVHQLKASGQETPYPVQKEQELISAILHGDKAGAAALLNELLGYIFFFTSNPDSIQTRVTELLVVLSRSALYGGANADLIFEINQRYMQELRRLRSQEEVAQWLARVLNRYTDLVFDLVDSKHKNVIQKAVGYMKLHCARHLSLGELADYVGYSHSHFSKVFKEEMGCGFRVYLNQLRVEKSKGLLLSGNNSLAEICQLCGFEDQSYYCKVFKSCTGVTPDKYRKQSRRIDSQREYGG